MTKPKKKLFSKQKKRGKLYVKGNPGGPGRPKGSGHPTFRSVVDEIRKLHPKALEWQNPDLGEILSDPFHMAVVQTVSAAQHGESWAIREILDRGFGKPFQALAVEYSGDINVHFDGADKAL